MIGPVPERKQLAVLEQMLEHPRTAWVPWRAEGLLQAIRRDAPDSQFWWVRRRFRTTAAAVMLPSSGNVGFLYHSPVWGESVVWDDLLTLVRGISTYALHDGVHLVQASIRPGEEENRPLLQDAGFVHLSTLLRMRCALEDPPPACPDDDAQWSFLHGSEYTRDELVRLIRQTYVDTLDCPLLIGRRPMEDILRSHETTGVYSPQWWWLAREGDLPAGCVLMNRLTEHYRAEIVYLGVAPEFRGRGLGGALLRRALHSVFEEGVFEIGLSVDAGNRYAKKLYERFGFEEESRRDCFALLPQQNALADEGCG